MVFDPEKHHRRSIRLKHYDYSQSGLYFVTLCTFQRNCWFGEIKDSQMLPNQIGKIVAEEWLNTPKIRSNVKLDEWIVMPNHFHGIIMIDNPENNQDFKVITEDIKQRKLKSLGVFIAGFKAAVTRRINTYRNTPDIPLWQRNYYESVIRDENHLEKVRQYIIKNPTSWQEDPDNIPTNQPKDTLSLNLLF
jgi:REP element-mobilizing transposase RayT